MKARVNVDRRIQLRRDDERGPERREGERRNDGPTCDDCGEPATFRYLRQNYCEECRPGEEREFDHCSLCYRPMDMAEESIPLCDRCARTCQAHARLDRDRIEQEQEERETGQRID